jgi:hypothetical protein
MLELGAHAYGPDSTPEEIAAIRARIAPLVADVILYREMPVQSPFHLDLFEQELLRLSAAMPELALLIDLTEAQPPSAQTRERLREIFGQLANLRAVAVFTHKNFVINLAAKFVLHGLGLKAYTIHRTREEALAALGHAR